MLNYTIHKTGSDKPWVTFVHGAGGSSTIWFRQIRRFSRAFNVLLVDLRGHGASQKGNPDKASPRYTFQSVSREVLDVLDHEGISQSHFAGISLGTIIIRQIAEDFPNRVQSMIMGGAILKLNTSSRILLQIGVIFKSLLPYLMLYRFFAFIIMPRKSHRTSRNLFVREAKKLCRKEFLRWFKLTAEINPLLKFFVSKDIPIPALFIMGSEDHLFLPYIKKFVRRNPDHSRLVVIPDCGHVVNVDKPDQFNEATINFINSVEEGDAQWFSGTA